MTMGIKMFLFFDTIGIALPMNLDNTSIGHTGGYAAERVVTYGFMKSGNRLMRKEEIKTSFVKFTATSRYVLSRPVYGRWS